MPGFAGKFPKGVRACRAPFLCWCGGVYARRVKVAAQFILIALIGPSFGCRDKTDQHIQQVAELVKARDYDGLAALLDDPDEALRCRAAKALAWVRAPEAVKHHVALLSYDACGFEVRAEAAFRILEADAWAEGFAPVAALLKDPQREMRWNAAKTLGLSRQPEAIPVLDACTEDPDVFVAAWCTWGLCRAKGGEKNACREPNMDLSRGRKGP